MCQVLLPLGRQAKTLLKDAGAQQDHQNLVVGDSRYFIDRMQAVEDADNLFLIKEWHRRKNGPSESVLH